MALSLACLILGGGCAEPSYRQQVLHDIQVRAQERLLHQARLDYDQGHYEETIQRLHRMVTLPVGSPLQMDAQWLLARSYHHMGRLKAAREYYQKVLHVSYPSRYGKQARHRLDELNALSDVAKRRYKDVRAIRLSLSQLAEPESFDALLRTMTQEGATTLLVDLGCHLFESSAPLGEKATVSWEITRRDLKKQVEDVTTQAHQRHLDVVAGVDLRCIGGPDVSSNRRWRDGRYDIRTRSVHRLRQYDLFNPHYQAFLETFLLNVVNAQLDGVLFLTGAPRQIVDGVTPSARQAFAKAFGFQLNLPDLFEGFAEPTKASLTSGTSTRRISAPQAPEFWRWIGWKSREQLAIMQRVMRRLLLPHPDLLFGLELHPESIDHPLYALIYESEDFLEAAQGNFNFFFVQTLADHESHVSPTHGEDGQGKWNPVDLVKRMMVALKNSRKIWMMTPVGWGKGLNERAMGHSNAGPVFPKGVGMVYDRRSLS